MKCEDWPCCGHEAGDCDGSLYGSDEDIKARVYEDIRNGHGDCDHESGIYHCDVIDVGDECDDEEHDCLDCDHKADGWECHWCGRLCPEGAHEDKPEPEDLATRADLTRQMVSRHNETGWF